MPRVLDQDAPRASAHIESGQPVAESPDAATVATHTVATTERKAHEKPLSSDRVAGRSSHTASDKRPVEDQYEKTSSGNVEDTDAGKVDNHGATGEVVDENHPLAFLFKIASEKKKKKSRARAAGTEVEHGNRREGTPASVIPTSRRERIEATAPRSSARPTTRNVSSTVPGDLAEENARDLSKHEQFSPQVVEPGVGLPPTSHQENQHSSPVLSQHSMAEPARSSFDRISQSVVQLESVERTTATPVREFARPLTPSSLARIHVQFVESLAELVVISSFSMYFYKNSPLRNAITSIEAHLDFNVNLTDANLAFVGIDEVVSRPLGANGRWRIIRDGVDFASMFIDSMNTSGVYMTEIHHVC